MAQKKDNVVTISTGLISFSLGIIGLLYVYFTRDTTGNNAPPSVVHSPYPHHDQSRSGVGGADFATRKRRNISDSHFLDKGRIILNPLMAK